MIEGEPKRLGGVKIDRTYSMDHTGQFARDYYTHEPITKFEGPDERGEIGSWWLPVEEYQALGNPQKIIFDTHQAPFEARIAQENLPSSILRRISGLNLSLPPRR